MNIKDDCVHCIVGQIDKALNLLNPSEEKTAFIKQEVLKKSKSFSFNHTPPYVARDVYEFLASELNMDDPLESIKQKSIEEAKKFIPFVKKQIQSSDDKLLAAIKTSVAGNVIDFGAKEQFDLKAEIQKIYETDFAIDDYEKFKQRLLSVDELLILGDNCGENVLDKVLIQSLNELYPNLTIYYATRGKPIINDTTMREAKELEIDKICNLIDSGVDTPGLEISRASKEFKEIFDRQKLILAKGMGNFECLESSNDERIFFLFKVKCNVVANSIKQNIGEIVMKNG